MNDDTKNYQGDVDQYASPEDQYTDAQQAPAVSAPAAKNFIFVAIFGVILIGLVFAFIGGGDEEQKPNNTGQTARPAQRAQGGSAIPPPMPVPTPPAPPVTPIVQPTPDPKPALIPTQDGTERAQRIRSSMIINGGGVFGNAVSKTTAEVNDNDPNVGFADSYHNQKDAPFAQARKLGDTSRLITQGKIIESILETPINTDIPGMIRAIVSRDIYAESGRAILIPKGSRLVGTYNNFVIRGNKRVNIIWSRVIRPDGIDIMIRSGATDQLGRAGIEGNADNKYAEIFASAFLVSAINIAVGLGVDAVSDTERKETTNTDGSFTRSTDATAEAATRAVDLFGNAGQNLVDGFLNLKPTITIDQGTRVNVFVNRDLIFPGNMTGQVKFIQ